jgi:hypothetical protein
MDLQEPDCVSWEGLGLGDIHVCLLNCGCEMSTMNSLMSLALCHAKNATGFTSTANLVQTETERVYDPLRIQEQILSILESIISHSRDCNLYDHGYDTRAVHLRWHRFGDVLTASTCSFWN